MVQSITFTAPSSPAPTSLHPTSAAKAGLPLVDALDLEVLAQKRLAQTSTSLEAALRVVENRLAQGTSIDG